MYLKCFAHSKPFLNVSFISGIRIRLIWNVSWVENQDRPSEKLGSRLRICSGLVHICLRLGVTQRTLLGAQIGRELRVGVWVTAEQSVRQVRVPILLLPLICRVTSGNLLALFKLRLSLLSHEAVIKGRKRVW